MLAELQNITKYYEQPGSGTRNIVLNKVSLTIGEKESVAIVGPSGSGKSTLLNILGTLDRPSAGKAFVGGTEVETLDDRRLADIRNQFIGFVFQLHHLLPQLTLIENILLPAIPVRDKSLRKITIERAHHLIERVGLSRQINQLPIQLSVGECQRAAVVRALVNQPRLLLADEPTGSLDAHNAGQLSQLLGDLNREQDLAVVVVTHSMDLASRMGKIYQLTSGELHLMSPL
ncbi:MAG: ABC transporter ATP-binding protein [Bacteroidetes bacterium]|nr:ABC transporter ATP-binding protein [Bacteroidota bacterium]